MNALALTNGAITVSEGATLAGSGAITSAVSVLSGGILSGSLALTNLTLASGAVISNAATATATPVVRSVVDVSGVLVKLSGDLVSGTVYTVLTAPKITGKPTLTDGPEHWIAAVQANADGTQSVIVRKATGFYIIVVENNGIEVPYAWLTNACPQLATADDVAVSNALVSAGANGLARWESYALGLDATKADSVVLCDAKQDAAADAVTFFARNVAPATNTNLSVAYVLEGYNGSAWQTAATSASNAVTISLPSVYNLFRFRTDIVLQ